MNNKKTGCGIRCVYLVIFLMFFTGCKDPVNIQSKWLDRKITVDASDTDWINYPFYYDEKTRSCVGMYNDDKNLYVCFQTMDQDLQRQILSQGFTVWFNKTGKKKKELGIHFPTRGRFPGPGGPPDRSGDMAGHPSYDSPERPDPHSGMPPGENNTPPGRQFQQVSAPDSELEILSSDSDEGYVSNPERIAGLGINVSYRIDDRGRFIYELKIPFVETDKTAFIAEASASNNIGVGFLTSGTRDMDRGDRGRGGMDRGGMGGGGMPRDGMPGGGQGGGPMHGGERGKSGKALEIWINVTLASKPGDI